MNETLIRSLIDDLVGSCNDRNLDRFIEHLDEAVVWDDPAMLCGSAVGRSAVREFSESILRAFPDFSYRIREPICIAQSGERVAIPWEITATHTGRFDPPGLGPGGSGVRAIGDEHDVEPGRSRFRVCVGGSLLMTRSCERFTCSPCLPGCDTTGDFGYTVLLNCH